MDQADLNVRRAAQIMGTAEGTVYKLRRNEVDDMMARSALRLARALGVSPYYLLGEREPRTSPDGSLLPEPHTEEESPTSDRLGSLEGRVSALAEALRLATGEIERLSRILTQDDHVQPRRKAHK